MTMWCYKLTSSAIHPREKAQVGNATQERRRTPDSSQVGNTTLPIPRNQASDDEDAFNFIASPDGIHHMELQDDTSESERERNIRRLVSGMSLTSTNYYSDTSSDEDSNSP